MLVPRLSATAQTLPLCKLHAGTGQHMACSRPPTETLRCSTQWLRDTWHLYTSVNTEVKMYTNMNMKTHAAGYQNLIKTSSHFIVLQQQTLTTSKWCKDGDSWCVERTKSSNIKIFVMGNFPNIKCTSQKQRLGIPPSHPADLRPSLYARLIALRVKVLCRRYEQQWRCPTT